MNLKPANLPLFPCFSVIVIFLAASALDAQDFPLLPRWATAPVGDPLPDARTEDSLKPLALPPVNLSLPSLSFAGAPRSRTAPPEEEEEMGDEVEFVEPSGGQGRKGRRVNFSTNVIVTSYPWSEFNFGDLNEQWDSAWKYEFNIVGHFGQMDQVDGYGAGYFSYDDRKWDNGLSSVKNQVYTIGGEIGAFLYPFKNPESRPINIPIVPFLRFGLGYNDGDFKNVPNGHDAFFSGDIDGLRVEAAAGVDVRVIIGRRFSFGIGTGINYWNAFEINGVARNGVGIIVIGHDHADFEGFEIFARMSVGLLF
jgi:hypothetical protein